MIMKKTRKLFVLIFSILFLQNLYSQSKEWSIMNTYSIPEGASGLAWDGTFLYFGIYGSNGSEIYQLDPSDGSYSLYFTGPQEDAYGLTYDGINFWTTDHPGSSSDPAIAIQMDASGSTVSQFNLPTHYMSGIAYDDGNFWVSAYYSPDGQIYKVDNTGTTIKEFAAPDNQPWDLSMGDSCLWMADYWGDAIYQIDTLDGSLMNSYPSEGTDPAGVVFDGTFLWYCDNGSGGVDYLYKVDLSGSGTPVIQVPTTNNYFGIVTIGNTVNWDMQINNTGSADLEITDISIPGGVPISTSATFPITVSPSANTTIPIEFSPIEYSYVNTTITISSNDPINQTIDVTLSGHGVHDGAAMTISEDTHNYGSVRSYAYTRWFLPIENIGSDVLVLDSIVSTDNNFLVDPDIEYPLNISLLDTFQLGIWYSPAEDASDNGEMHIYSNNSLQNPDTIALEGTPDDSEWPMGSELWNYTLTGSYDVSPKGIIAIPDINGDGVNDVVIASEDATYRCFNGNSHGTADLLWENTTNGSLYQQNAIQTINDINGDGYDDVIVGSAWGDRSVIALSGKTGENLWKYDTHIYGEGGWIYQVDVSYDYNNDGKMDVLAASGDDADGNGPRRVHCLNSTDGNVIWEYQSDGAVFSVVGVEDFTGDGIADVIAGSTNSDETEGAFFGLDGSDGSLEWNKTVYGSSVWAVGQLSDITGDGIKDVIAGDFGMTTGGNTFYLDPTIGDIINTGSVSNSTLVLRFEAMDDINDDGINDILPSHSGSEVVVLDGENASSIWDYSVTSPDKPWCSRVVEDITGDGINDVIAGTLYSANELIFLDGVYGTELETISYGDPLDAMNVISDITLEGSMEVVAGGRDGNIVCYSGGTFSAYPIIEAPESHDFGFVDFGELAIWDMTVTNNGNAQLKINTIEAFTYNEYFYSTENFPIIIDAGASQDVEVVFNATGINFVYEDSLRIISNDPVHPELNVTVNAIIPDGVQENILGNKISVYPIPAKEKAIVELETSTPDPVNIAVYNANGQLVYKTIADFTTDTKFNWNCINNDGEQVEKGTYFMKIEIDGKGITKRIIVL